MTLHRVKPPASNLAEVVFTESTRGIKRLVVPYHFWDRTTECAILIPHGFEWDGASVPRLIWPVIPPFSLSIVFGLIHDFQYRFAGVCPEYTVQPYRTFTREESDEGGYQIMKQEGVRRWRRNGAMWAIRRWGASSWGNKPPKLTLDG